MLWQQDGYREGRSGRRGSTHGPCVILTSKEQQAAKRAAQLKRLAALPEHLRLGVTLPGMRELLKLLPPDAVEQVNAKIPIDEEDGQAQVPQERRGERLRPTNLDGRPVGKRRWTRWPCASG